MRDMAIHRYLLLIVVLWCAVLIYGILLDANDAETCNLLRSQCNTAAVFANDQLQRLISECSFPDSDVKNVECIERLQREIETIDLNTLSEDLTDEERDVRSLLKSKHRLRTGDAEKVAQYFINGGPMAGHSHFVKAFDTAVRDSADHAINSLSDMNNKIKLESEFFSVPIINADFRDSSNSPLSVVPEVAGPGLTDVETYDATNRPIFGNPTTNALHDLMTPLVGVSHHTLHQSPLLRAVTLPGHILHNLIGHHVHHYHHHHHHHHHHHPLYYRRNANGRSTNNQDTVAASNPVLDNSQYNTEIPRIFDVNTTHQSGSGYYYTSYINPLVNSYPLNSNYYPLPIRTPLVPYPIVSPHWQDLSSKQSKPLTTTAETVDSTAKINNIDGKKPKNKVKNDISE